RRVVEKSAELDVPILIEGETGTGKDLVAQAIHAHSGRAGGPIVTVNCAAVAQTLLESELFGHVKGAFSGATADRTGLAQSAEGGTLFLDEIGEMPTSMQVKLLRALQEKRVRKVGGNREEPVDARIIAATNRDLQQMVQEGLFREDLFYRINVIPIDLPPLRRRREDVPLLVDYFLLKCSREMGVEPKRVTVEAMKLLEGYDWPGNVRELENVIERALALSAGENLSAEDLPEQVRTGRPQPSDTVQLPAEGLALEPYLDDIRRQLMAEALDRCDGVQTQAADLVGMSFRSFRYYAKKLGLTGGGETEVDG
ncbi:MAG: sigma-54 dependent transcriptional regulator, partial [Thermoanaerobaculia bacterium]|nr:sigma-54 dependent transcriptional regulator [Thermoanaerobaculia bacterium]